MAGFKILIGSLLAAFSFYADAAYVNLKPPPGWSQGGAAIASVGQGIFTPASAGVATSLILGRISANAALTVAGSDAAIPVMMRLGAGAASVAATYAYANPTLFVLGTAAAGVIAWYAENKFEVVNDVWNKKEELGGLQYSNNLTQVWHSSESGAVSEALSLRKTESPSNNYSVTSNPAPLVYKYTVTRAEDGRFVDTGTITLSSRAVPPSTTFRPVPLAEFVNTMAPKKVPQPIFKYVPDYFEWPVDLPYIDPLTDEESTSFGRPFYVPTGLPILNPDALTWNQPAVKVTPAPTPSTPWRVDVAPVNIPQTTVTPKTPDQLNPKPVTSIDPVTGNPVTTTPTPTTSTPSSDKPVPLCEQFPDILACQKLGSAEVPDLETRTPTIAITPDSGWTYGSGMCPVPRHLVGANIDFTFAPYCDFLSGIKPVIIAAAWIAGAFILLGFKGSEE